VPPTNNAPADCIRRTRKSMSELPFPHEILTKIDDEPDAATIKQLKREVYANLRAIPSTLGGGDNGYLGLAMPAGAYTIRAGVPFTEPNHPGDLPIYAVGTTSHLITAGNRVYDANLASFNKYITVRNAVKKQIMEAVHKRYYAALEDDLMGMSDIAVLTILNHLTTNYGTVTASDLITNRSKLETAWNPDQPFEDFWKHIQIIRNIATAGGDPILDGPTIELSLSALRKAGVYGHAIDTWYDKPEADQTWDNYQTHFRQQEKVRIKKLTAKHAGYGNANEASHLIPPNDPAPAPGTAAATTNRPGETQYICHETKVYYCSTHGLTLNVDHTSLTCQKPGANHNKTATLLNRKGGSDLIKCGRAGKASA
jgi:hypothetical protein